MRAARIAISGVGAVSALGLSAASTFDALLAGERGIAPLSLFDVGDVRSRNVAEVRGLCPAEHAPAGVELSRTDAMAVLAAREAAAQARLSGRSRVGLLLGGTTGGMFETETALSSPELPTISAERAAQLLSYPLSASLGHVARAVGGVVRARSVCSACSSGAIALAQAAAWLWRGDVDQVLAGGADGLCRLTLLGFNSLGATDPEPCRPFDRSRAGLSLGEGAAVLVLEREETALSRGAAVLAYLDGFAVGAEGHHITHPDPEGARAKRLLREALARAGITPEELGYVNAHGTGTQQNDAMEARALADVLGPRARDVWVSSSKAQLGHTLGASGALEAVITVLALLRGRVPPSVGLVEPELAGLRYVEQRGQAAPLQAALSSSFGFGGMSCVLAFGARSRPAPELELPRARVSVLASASLGASSEPEKLLDPERSRRFDRASCLTSAGAAQVGAPGGEGIGLVLGTAFGNVERTMALLARARARGPRHVAPAEFPHLVPSAPAGNASVYAGLRGPVFAVSDLWRSGEAAFASGCELIEAGAASSMIVGAVAPRDAIVERVLGPLLDPGTATATPRGEGAGFVRLELASPDSTAPELLARWLNEPLTPQALAALPPPPERAGVVLAYATSETRALLAASSWAAVPQRDTMASEGFHEALGGVALAQAAQAVVAGELEQVLVLSGDSRSFCAFLLGRPRAAGS